jgi:hypothetical protein
MRLRLTTAPHSLHSIVSLNSKSLLLLAREDNRSAIVCFCSADSTYVAWNAT